MKRIQELVNYYITLLNQIEGDILIYAKSSYVKTIFMLVGIYSPPSKKVIFIEDVLSLEKYLISKNQNILIFEDNKDFKIKTSKYILLKYNINAIFEVYNKRMISEAITPPLTYSVELIKEEYQNAVFEVSNLNTFYIITQDNVNKYPFGELETIRFVKKYGEFSITYKNLASLLRVLHSEFKDKTHKQIDLSNLTFEEGFIYILYFIESDHTVFFEDKLSLDKRPRLIFYGNKEVNFACCTNMFKIKIYKRFNVETLNKYWLLKPILYLRNTHIIKNSYKLNKGDELYFLNRNFRNLEKKTFKQSFVNVNFLFGTRNTCYVLGINTKEDKKVFNVTPNIVKNEYRIMAWWEDSIDVSFNSINQMMLSGDSVIESEMKYFTKFGDKDKLYTNEGLYFKKNEDFISLIANKEDIVYFKDKFINIGFIKKSLKELPYVKDCILLVEKSNSNSIHVHPMIVLENSFILRQIMSFKTTSSSIKALLLNKRIDLQKKIDDSVKVLMIDIIDDLYLKEVRSNFESDYNFINYIAYRTTLI